MNRKELNMSKKANNNNQTVDEKKGKRTGLTILGYVLVIVALLIVLPVVLPPIFGYHTYLSGTDHTGNISKYGSVVYLKTIDEASYEDGNIAAIESSDSSNRTVDSYYVDSNDSSAKEIALRDGNGVSPPEWVCGMQTTKYILFNYSHCSARKQRLAKWFQRLVSLTALRI